MPALQRVPRTACSCAVASHGGCSSRLVSGQDLYGVPLFFSFFLLFSQRIDSSPLILHVPLCDWIESWRIGNTSSWQWVPLGCCDDQYSSSFLQPETYLPCLDKTTSFLRILAKPHNKSIHPSTFLCSYNSGSISVFEFRFDSFLPPARYAQPLCRLELSPRSRPSLAEGRDLSERANVEHALP